MDNNNTANISNSNNINGSHALFADNCLNGIEQQLKAPFNDDLSQLVASCKIDLQEELQPAPVAMQIMSNGELITLFTKGNFSIITGPAKSRKTFLVSMLAAAVLLGKIQDLLICDTGGTVIVFDTEQSRYKTQQITKRICRLSGCDNPQRLHVYSLRTLDPVQRKALIQRVLEITPNISFVIIDGIVDLDIDPILQADQAQGIVSDLMKWTEKYNIHISCVLHFNKRESTLLGHLGSFSHRKADAIISVKKSPDNEEISLVEPVDCREREFHPFAFTVNSTGLPFILEDFSNKGKPNKLSEKLQPEDVEVDQHQKIVDIAFTTSIQMKYEETWRSIKTAMQQIISQSADNQAKKFLTYYVDNGFIQYVNMPNKQSYYKRAIEILGNTMF